TRRTELPPREAALLVVAATSQEAEAAAAALAALGYGRVDWLDAALGAVPGALADRSPAVRLWRVAPFLEEVLPRILAVGAGARRALDLAAGAGREAVFLA